MLTKLMVASVMTKDIKLVVKEPELYSTKYLVQNNSCPYMDGALYASNDGFVT